MDSASDRPLDSIGVYLSQIGMYRALSWREEVELAIRIEVGVTADHHLKELLECIVKPSYEVRRNYRWLIRSGQLARDQLIGSNLRFAFTIAKRFQYRGLDLPDLVQFGNIGLIYAVDKYDYMKGHRFATYASWWIRATIQRGIANDARLIRLPVRILEKIATIEQAEKEADDAYSRKAAIRLAASRLGVSPTEVTDLKQASLHVMSLDHMLSGELGDIVDSDVTGQATPHEQVFQGFLPDQIQAALDGLPKLDAGVLRAKNGILRDYPISIESVASIFGLDVEQVRCVENRALRRLRESTQADALREYYYS